MDINTTKHLPHVANIWYHSHHMCQVPPPPLTEKDTLHPENTHITTQLQPIQIMDTSTIYEHVLLLKMDCLTKNTTPTLSVHLHTRVTAGSDFIPTSSLGQSGSPLAVAGPVATDTSGPPHGKVINSIILLQRKEKTHMSTKQGCDWCCY